MNSEEGIDILKHRLLLNCSLGTQQYLHLVNLAYQWLSQSNQMAEKPLHVGEPSKMIAAALPLGSNSHNTCKYRVQDQCKNAWSFQRVQTTVDGPFPPGEPIRPSMHSELLPQRQVVCKCYRYHKNCTRIPPQFTQLPIISARQGISKQLPGWINLGSRSWHDNFPLADKEWSNCSMLHETVTSRRNGSAMDTNKHHQLFCNEYTRHTYSNTDPVISKHKLVTTS